MLHHAVPLFEARAALQRGCRPLQSTRKQLQSWSTSAAALAALTHSPPYVHMYGLCCCCRAQSSALWMTRCRHRRRVPARCTRCEWIAC